MSGYDMNLAAVGRPYEEIGQFMKRYTGRWNISRAPLLKHGAAYRDAWDLVLHAGREARGAVLGGGERLHGNGALGLAVWLSRPTVASLRAL